MSAENKEKYLKLFDMLEIQISNVEKKTATQNDVVSVFIALIDKVSLDDLERAVSLLFDQDQVYVIFTTLASLTSFQDFPHLKIEIIIMSWLEALSRHWLHVNMHIMTLYQPLVLD